uniref:MIF4G domain-containing protein n=1 Tax=Caenorhabditis tropicalis TaxID=1561998 RepID=A0A1I7UUG4_9PELO
MAVFYAELFVKLSLENGSRFELIGNALADQIDEILKFTPKDEYMKSLLRAFKVAGAELDTSEPLRQRVDQILTIMGGYAKGSPLLSDTVKAQIFSLIECRTRGWDRVASSRVDPPAGYVAYRDNDSFDDSLDNDLTEEERQFLERNLDQVEAGKNGEDDIDDQEVMKEFGKFVKEELQQAEEQKTAEMFQGCSIEDEETNKTPAEDK